MRLLVSGVILSFVLASPVVAGDAARCAQMANADDRLACYDALYRVVETPPTQSAWDIRITTSQLDDSRRVTLIVTSDEPLAGRFGRNDNANLIIRCEQNTTSLYITWGGHFMSDTRGGGRVDYRVDARAPAHVTMRPSNDNQALGLWRGNASIPFIRQLFGGASLYVRATPFSESRIEARFNISGLEEEIAPLREACNW